MLKHKAHSCLGLVSAGLIAMTSGCGVETPFARNIDDVNLSGEQLPARIQLSDAQVFSREALINDRLREIKFLAKLIEDESVRSQFQPQLQRDLTHITTMAAQMGVGFNPSTGLQNEQALDQNDRLHEIQMKKLDIELRRLERELESLDQGGSAAPLDDTSPRALTDPPKADVKAVLDQLGNLNSQVTDLLKRDFQRAKTQASPEHIYRDWQAYRAELRADEHAAKLDDIHDGEGRTLYRMQFTATILPGQEKDKFGIAMVDVLPPKLKRHELNRLYYDWLKHVNARLNLVTKNGIVPDPFYQRLGQSTNLYRYVHAEIEATDPLGTAKPETLRIAVHPKVEDFVQAVICLAYKPDDDDGDWPGSRVGRICKDLVGDVDDFGEGKPEDIVKRLAELFAEDLDTILSERQAASLKSGATADTFDKDTDVVCAAGDSVESAILAFNRIIDTPGSGFDLESDAVRSFYFETITIYDDGRDDLKCDSDANDEKDKIWRWVDPPKQFLKVVRGETKKTANGNGNPDQRFELRGGSSAYAANPVERAQRLSTVASAANAMQMAMAFSAVLPSAGLNIGGGAAYQEIAIGKIDALERAPLVIGFADRNIQASNDNDAYDAARFGWLFGPPIRVDTENDRLVHRHIVANHRVLADVSVPAWWPSVTLKVHSAWIGNWDDPDEAIANAEAFQNRHPGRFMVQDPDARTTACGKRLPNQFCQPVHVELPQTAADFHALTNELAQVLLQQPLRAPSIDRVVPSTIAACAEEVQFFVYGTDLWRAPVANLRGVKAKKHEVLPDMAGIAVTFDINTLPLSPTPGLPDRLWIVTQNGPVGEEIEIKGDKTAKDCGIGASGPELVLALDSSPVIDQLKGTEITFKVTSGALPTAYHKIFVKVESVNTEQKLEGTAELKAVSDRKVLKLKNGEKFKFPGTIKNEDMSGASLVASILVSPLPNIEDKDATVLAEDFKMQLCTKPECDITLTSLPTVIEAADAIKLKIKLPAGLGRLYPGLKRQTSLLGGYIDDRGDGSHPRRIELTPVALDFPDGDFWRTGHDLELAAVLAPPRDENGWIDPGYVRLLESTGARLKLRWVLSDGAEAPDLPDDEILLKP